MVQDVVTWKLEQKDVILIIIISDNSTNEQQYLSFTYRKYLGVDCKTIKENVNLKQQLELMKMCGRVNNNPSLAHNENFRLLVSKCRGVTPTIR